MKPQVLLGAFSFSENARFLETHLKNTQLAVESKMGEYANFWGTVCILTLFLK
jgi:hypothetical protein